MKSAKLSERLIQVGAVGVGTQGSRKFNLF